jgi:hypothetical protein
MDAAAMLDFQNNDPVKDETINMDLKQLQDQASQLQFEKAKEQLRADQAEAKVAEMDKQVQVISAERDDARDKLELAEAEAKVVEAKREDSIRASVKLRQVAVTALPASDKPDRFDDMSDRDVKLAVIEHISGKRVDADKTDDYVDARFDGAVESKPAPATGGKVAGRVDAVQVASSEKTMIANQRTALRNIHPYYKNN